MVVPTAPVDAAPARPSLRNKGSVDFKVLWDDLSAASLQLLRDPYSAPMMPLSDLTGKVYRIACGPCVNVPKVTLPPEMNPQGKTIFAATLYGLLRDLIAAHLAETVEPRLRPLTHQELLIAYVHEWNRFEASLHILVAIYTYAHNAWKSSMPANLVSSRKLGYSVWRDDLYNKVKENLIRGALVMINQQRDGVVFDNNILKVTLGSFMCLSPYVKKPLYVYQSHFESNYLTHAEDAFRRLAQATVRRETPLPQMLSTLVVRIQQELQRAEDVLHPTTLRPLAKIVGKTVIDRYVDVFLAAFADWVQRRCVTELRDLYWLLSRSEAGSQALANAVREQVVAIGRAEVERNVDQQAPDPDTFVSAVVGTVEGFNELVEQAFGSSQAIKDALHAGARAFTNNNAVCKRSAIAAELAAAYANSQLKSAQKGSADTDAAVSRVALVLRLVDDKDVFQARYGELLSRRLIASSHDAEAEEAMVSGICRASTHEFSYKWCRMLSDVARVQQHRDVMHQVVAESADADVAAAARIDFSPYVLTHGSWPLVNAQTTVVPPRAIRALCGAFEAAYRKAHDAKLLTWLHIHSHGVIETCVAFARARHNAYQLTVNMPQAAVLMAFNARPATAEYPLGVVHADAVAAESGIPADTITRAMVALTRQKLLTEAGAGAWTINKDFSNGSRKVTLNAQKEPVLRVKGAVPESEVAAKATNERKFAVQAAIVRVMKSRKVLGYAQLVAEVTEVLASKSFTPTAQLIKSNIEALMDKEYIARSKDDNEKLMYLAN